MEINLFKKAAKLRNSQINSIHYLRGAAALFVVLYHLKFYLNGVYGVKLLGDLLFKFGAFGVDLFFVISGFVICLATEKKENRNPVVFLTHRVLRIYPLLIFCMMLFYFVFNYGADIAPFFRGVIPANANYNAGAPFFGWNVLIPAWTLTYEIAFYAIFLLSMLINEKHRALISAFFIAVLVFSIQAIFSGEVILSAYNSNSFARGHWYHSLVTLLASPLFLDFIYGIFIFSIYSYMRDNKIVICNRWAVVLIALLFSSLSVVVTYTNAGHGPMRWGIACAVIIMTLVVIETKYKLKDSVVMFLIGDISYSLYLSHEIVIRLCTEFAEKHGFVDRLKGFPALLVMVFICLVVAYVLHRTIERPFISAGRKISRKLACIGT